MKAERFHAPRGNLKNLAAFFLACLSFSAFLELLPLFSLSSKQGAPIHVTIRSTTDASSVANVIRALHRSDVVVSVQQKTPGWLGIVSTTFGAAFGFMIIVGIILGLYKFYCYRLGAEDTM